MGFRMDNSLYRAEYPPSSILDEIMDLKIVGGYLIFSIRLFMTCLDQKHQFYTEVIRYIIIELVIL
jgi:hypothetical protein